MAYLKIIHEGDPMLRQTSRPVTEITPRILQLRDDMTNTMHRANGCGLAAVQVGNTVLIRRWYRKGSAILLQSGHPAFPPLLFSGDERDGLRPIGIVTGFTARFD